MNAMSDKIIPEVNQCVDPEVITPSVAVDETFWGYILRDEEETGTLMYIFQWLALIVGGGMFVAVAGLWLMPGATIMLDVLVFKLGFSTLMAVVGSLLLWFSSHGAKYEVQIDLARMELREALRNDRGQVRVQNRIKFDEFDAVILERAPIADQKSRLLLRLAGTTEAIEVVSDFEGHLKEIKARLRRDVLGKKRSIQVKPARGFLHKGAQGLVQEKAAA